MDESAARKYRKCCADQLSWQHKPDMHGYTTTRANENVSEHAMAFFMSNGCTVVWGMDLKWKSL